MSKKLCPLCRETVYKFPEHNIPNGLYHCGMCEKNFTDEEVLNDDLFQSITQSPELLAKELVYMVEYVSGFIAVRKWTSNLIESEYANFEGAFAATAARLKEI